MTGPRCRCPAAADRVAGPQDVGAHGGEAVVDVVRLAGHVGGIGAAGGTGEPDRVAEAFAANEAQRSDLGSEMTSLFVGAASRDSTVSPASRKT